MPLVLSLTGPNYAEAALQEYHRTRVRVRRMHVPAAAAVPGAGEEDDIVTYMEMIGLLNIEPKVLTKATNLKLCHANMDAFSDEDDDPEDPAPVPFEVLEPMCLVRARTTRMPEHALRLGTLWSNRPHPRRCAQQLWESLQ